jgi:hypothetical protein
VVLYTHFPAAQEVGVSLRCIPIQHEARIPVYHAANMIVSTLRHITDFVTACRSLLFNIQWRPLFLVFASDSFFRPGTLAYDSVGKATRRGRLGGNAWRPHNIHTLQNQALSPHFRVFSCTTICSQARDAWRGLTFTIFFKPTDVPSTKVRRGSLSRFEAFFGAA